MLYTPAILSHHRNIPADPGINLTPPKLKTTTTNSPIVFLDIQKAYKSNPAIQE